MMAGTVPPGDTPPAPSLRPFMERAGRGWLRAPDPTAPHMAGADRGRTA